MTQDPEIIAMDTLVEVLDRLDDEARKRVLDWASLRFHLAAAVDPQRPAVEADHPAVVGVERPTSDDITYIEFVDLFDAARPRTDPERALVGAYWFQAVGGMTDLQSQQVNEALKDVGHGVGNITDALTKLQRRKPALVRQVAKSGRTRQARKKYKVTSAGITAVQAMITRADED